MSFSDVFHDSLKKVNPFPIAERFCNQKREEHSNLYKGVLILNHLFRAIPIWACFKCSPGPLKAKLIMGLLSSVFYRLTVEPNCSYKFAIPAFFGAVTFLRAGRSVTEFINGSAFRSSNLGKATLNVVPLSLYFTYIVLTTDYDVNYSKCCSSRNNRK